MRIRDVGSILADLMRINRGFVTSSPTRAALRRASGRYHRVESPTTAAERAAAPMAALAYDGLSSASLVLSGIRVEHGATAHLNVTVGEVSEKSLFAGVHTALAVAGELATALGLPLRVVMLDPTSPGNSAGEAAALIADRLGLDAIVVERESVRAIAFSPVDYWLATHSKTAHSVQVACIAGVLSSDRVVYLVQDYEPGFSPWSTESVTAAATYHAGFLPLVNSVPLATYLHQAEGMQIDPALVFAPQFDEESLRRTATARHGGAPLRVLFYGRPGKARNLFRLGVSALGIAAAQLKADGIAAEFVSVGEPHTDIDLPTGDRIVSLGRLSWNEYFDYLATAQVVLSLQQSPHPSHPPFDAAISGATAVTNDFNGDRGSLHPRIVTAVAEPLALGTAIADAVRSAAENGPGEYLAVDAAALGGTLSDALAATVARLKT